jgi:hypothetical protein
MKRFRFTLLAICLVLLYLGGNDLYLMLRNPAPLVTTLAELELNGPRREWLTLSDTRLDLLEAISTSGTIELEAFLIPLKTDPSQKTIRVMLETRDPAIIELLQTYYFKIENESDRQTFLENNRTAFFPRRSLTGMVVGGLIATANRDKLASLAKELNIPVAEDVVFISEGKTPPRWRGIFFTLVALAGLFKTILWWKKK